jgi:hypothetical protein
VVATREVPSLQLKKIFKKGCKIFAAHMEETPKDKVARIEDNVFLKEFEYVIGEILGFPPKRDLFLYEFDVWSGSSVQASL